MENFRLSDNPNYIGNPKSRARICRGIHLNSRRQTPGITDHWRHRTIRTCRWLQGRGSHPVRPRRDGERSITSPFSGRKCGDLLLECNFAIRLTCSKSVTMIYVSVYSWGLPQTIVGPKLHLTSIYNKT